MISSDRLRFEEVKSIVGEPRYKEGEPRTEVHQLRYTITFKERSDLEKCLTALNKCQWIQPKHHWNGLGLMLDLTNADYSGLIGECLGSMNMLFTDFRQSIQMMKRSIDPAHMNKDEREKIFNAFDNLVKKAEDEVKDRSIINCNIITLYKSVELNYDLFDQMFLQPHHTTVPELIEKNIKKIVAFKTLEVFYREHVSGLPGRGWSWKGQLLSVIAVILGMAAVFLGIHFGAPIVVDVAGASASLIGLFGINYHRGTGYCKAQEAILDRREAWVDHYSRREYHEYSMR